MRESPALDLLPALAREGGEVRAHDPCAIEMAKVALDGSPLAYCRNLWACLEDADVAVMLTQWQEYLALDWARVAAAMRGKIRSEEHTSELQSLMRTSYAVFCLKKTNSDLQQHTISTRIRTNTTTTN